MIMNSLEDRIEELQNENARLKEQICELSIACNNLRSLINDYKHIDISETLHQIEVCERAFKGGMLSQTLLDTLSSIVNDAGYRLVVSRQYNTPIKIVMMRIFDTPIHSDYVVSNVLNRVVNICRSYGLRVVIDGKEYDRGTSHFEEVVESEV